MGPNYKQNALGITAKARFRGTTLLEASLALSLVMMSGVGCLTTFQMAIKLCNSVALKTRALIEAECVVDAVSRTPAGDRLNLLLNAEKIRLEAALPGSVLSWREEQRVEQQVEQVYLICFSWVLRDAHRVEFIAMPEDFR